MNYCSILSFQGRFLARNPSDYAKGYSTENKWWFRTESIKEMTSLDEILTLS